MQTSKREEILDEYLLLLAEFQRRLAEMDEKHGTFARIEIAYINITNIGDRLRRYMRNIRLTGLDL